MVFIMEMKVKKPELFFRLTTFTSLVHSHVLAVTKNLLHFILRYVPL